MLPGGHMRDHPSMTCMLTKGVSTDTESAFSDTKSSSGMGGSPNACVNYVAAPPFVKLTEASLMLEHMGELAKEVSSCRAACVPFTCRYVLQCCNTNVALSAVQSLLKVQVWASDASAPHLPHITATARGPPPPPPPPPGSWQLTKRFVQHASADGGRKHLVKDKTLLERHQHKVEQTAAAQAL